MNINPLRQKVVDYMKKMASLEWTPEKDFVVCNPGKNGCTTMLGVFRAGTTYYGPPYINGNMCNEETFNEKRIGAYKPFTGTQEQLDKITSVTALREIGGEILNEAIDNAFTFPGNDCIGSVLLAWNTVINNSEKIQQLQFCHNTIPYKNSCVVRVGEYACNEKHDCNTDFICEENGEQIMAKAYAKLLPGDAVTHVKSSKGNARHIRLVIGLPYVEYMTEYNGQKVLDENGEMVINLDKSYVKLLDQAGGSFGRYIKENIKGSLQEHERTFRELYEIGDLPITIPELVEGKNEAENTVLTDAVVDTILKDKKISGMITSNRQIIYVRGEITDGFVVHNIKDIIRLADLVKRTRNYHAMKYDLANLDFSCFNFKEGTQYTLNIYVCTSGNDGKEINLVRDYKFNA